MNKPEDLNPNEAVKDDSAIDQSAEKSSDIGPIKDKVKKSVNKVQKRFPSIVDKLRSGYFDGNEADKTIRHKILSKYIVNHISINKLKLNPDQPRKHFDPESLKELENSIDEYGILQPILAREDDEGNIFIVAGERRYQAAKNIGKKEVPCLAVDGDPAVIALIENLLRKDLTAVEEAEAMQKIIDQHNYTQEHLSKVIGKARSTLAEILTINRLPEEIRNECRKNSKCSKSVLIELARLESPEEMVKEYRRFEKKGITRDEIRIAKKGEPREKLEVTKSSIKTLKYKLVTIQNDWTVQERQAIMEELQDLVSLIQQVLDGYNQE